MTDHLANFNFAASEIHEPTVRTLHPCEFLDGVQNVVLISGLGTGKPQGRARVLAVRLAKEMFTEMRKRLELARIRRLTP